MGRSSGGRGGDALTTETDGNDIGKTGHELETDEAEVEEENPWAEMVEADNLMGLERVDIEASNEPLPASAEGKEEAQALASQQKEDKSLAPMRITGEEQADGFTVDENGVLVQVKLMTLGKEVKRMAIRTTRRREILMITHRPGD